MKDYYAILGLQKFAGLSEVRRAYRKLVQKYHPDVNPAPSASVVIREINEAYETLGDEQKKREYDSRLITLSQQQATTQFPPQRQHRDPRYRNPYRRPVKKDNSQLELMKEYLHIAVNVCKAGCALCLFLLIDVLIPHRVVSDTMRSGFHYARGRSTTTGFISQAGRSIKVSEGDLLKMKQGMKIEIYETRITGIVTGIYLPEAQHRVTSLATLYRNYVFVPLLLLVTSVLGLLIKTQIEMKFNMGIVSFLLTIFTLILIFN